MNVLENGDEGFSFLKKKVDDKKKILLIRVFRKKKKCSKEKTKTHAHTRTNIKERERERKTCRVSEISNIESDIECEKKQKKTLRVRRKSEERVKSTCVFKKKGGGSDQNIKKKKWGMFGRDIKSSNQKTNKEKKVLCLIFCSSHGANWWEKKKEAEEKEMIFYKIPLSLSAFCRICGRKRNATWRINNSEHPLRTDTKEEHLEVSRRDLTVSFTAAKTNRIFEVSVACVKLGKEEDHKRKRGEGQSPSQNSVLRTLKEGGNLTEDRY